MRFDAEAVKRVYSTPPGGYAEPPPGTVPYYREQVALKVQQAFFDAVTLRERAYATCKLDPTSSVLLLCCGSAHDVPFITKYTGPGVRVVGIDFSAAMLETGRAFVNAHGATNVELHQGDATADLPIGGATFDLTCCAFGFSIIPSWERAYANLVRHTKDGGRILVIDVRCADGWRSLLNPAFALSLRRYGATREGNRNFMRVAERMKRDLVDVTVGLEHFAGFVSGTRPHQPSSAGV